jgi:hypothetical protein
MLKFFKKCKYFSTIDLTSEYWQVSIAIEDKEKTAFITKQEFFKFIVILFGLTNAPATF